MARISHAYLVLYNSFQFIGWAAVLALLLTDIATLGLSKTNEIIYAHVGRIVRLLQLAASLEVIHPILGLTKTSPFTAFIQFLGRNQTLFLVLDKVPSIQGDWSVTALFFAWSAIEVVRYPFYVCALLNSMPRWLEWLRYNLFVPLYPLGAFCEAWIVYWCLGDIRARDLYSVHMPNAFNMAFDFYSWLVFDLVLLYPLGFPYMYLHMFAQRNKKAAAAAATSRGYHHISNKAKQQ